MEKYLLLAPDSHLNVPTFLMQSTFQTMLYEKSFEAFFDSIKAQVK